MGPAQKVHLADEIFARQPNLLDFLALTRMGVAPVKLEVPLHILFVTFQAMKRSGHAWPIVSEDVQDSCMQRFTARARFNEGLPGELADQVVQQFCDENPERYTSSSTSSVGESSRGSSSRVDKYRSTVIVASVACDSRSNLAVSNIVRSLMICSICSLGARMQSIDRLRFIALSCQSDRTRTAPQPIGWLRQHIPTPTIWFKWRHASAPKCGLKTYPKTHSSSELISRQDIDAKRIFEK